MEGWFMSCARIWYLNDNGEQEMFYCITSAKTFKMWCIFYQYVQNLIKKKFSFFWRKLYHRYSWNICYCPHFRIPYFSVFPYFYAPDLKGPQGHLVIGSSVCLSVCLSVQNSVPLTNKVQYLKFGWWYSNQTLTVGSSMSYSHFTDITCPWGGAGQNAELCCRWGHPCFTNTCLVSIYSPWNIYEKKREENFSEQK